MKKRNLSAVLLLLSLFLWSCKNKGTSNADAVRNTEVKTPAKAVTISRQSMQNAVWLNAISTKKAL